MEEGERFGGSEAERIGGDEGERIGREIAGEEGAKLGRELGAAAAKLAGAKLGKKLGLSSLLNLLHYIHLDKGRQAEPRLVVRKEGKQEWHTPARSWWRSPVRRSPP